MLIRQPIVLLEKRRLTDIRTTQIMGMYPVRVCAPCDNWSGPRVRGVNTEVSPSRLNTTPVAPRAVLISLIENLARPLMIPRDRAVLALPRFGRGKTKYMPTKNDTAVSMVLTSARLYNGEPMPTT